MAPVMGAAVPVLAHAPVLAFDQLAVEAFLALG
jgi:hypothetical protein